MRKIQESIDGKVGPLNLIFDYLIANDYLKIILSKADFYLAEWYTKYETSNLNDLRTKIDATKDLIRLCRQNDKREETLKFIFWSLFALSVDKNSYEEKVSLIADFAHMIEIDEKTIRDIAKVIKVIFGEEEEEFKFETDEIPIEFGEVLNNTIGYKVK
ncbi:hypothetical protein [Clostridium sp.]|uniref:hypothetical protein n=1 Tax=Clostridium sp. TaxID=1506 RepID=UPI003D6D047B